MRDLGLFAAILCTCTVIGYPLCLLFPADRFRLRFLCAPALGFGLLGIVSTILYARGVAPAISLAALTALGLAATLAHVVMRRPAPLTSRDVVVASVTAVVALICLLPALTGGSVFTVFQGNVYDQIGYLAAATSYRHHDYATLMGLSGALDDDPVVYTGYWLLSRRPTHAIVYAAYPGLVGLTTLGGVYAYLAALQANMMFAATFVLANVFNVRTALALLLGAALSLGFFSQYVIDINAWTELASKPLYLLLVAAVALSFLPRRFGDDEVRARLRIALLFGLLLASVIYLYPEALSVYAPAAAAAAVVAIAAARRGPWRPIAFVVLALAAGTLLALVASLAYLDGTLGWFYRQMTGQALAPLDWWKYYQAYLYGRETDHLAVLTGRVPSSPLRFVIAILSLPVAATMGAAGLYHLLPTPSWPILLAAPYSLVLVAFVVVLYGGAAATVIRHARKAPGDASVPVFAACIAGLAVPVVILAMGQYWSAGKGLSMATPLLFMIVVAPLMLPANSTAIARAASVVFVLTHIGLGLARPIGAADPSGAGGMLGFPPGVAQVMNQKPGQDWRHERWGEALRSCRHVAIDVENRFLNTMIAIVATDLGVAWSASWPTRLKLRPEGPTRLELFDQADCLATTDLVQPRPDQRLIWLSTDNTSRDYMAGRANELEIGVATPPGVKATGMHDTQSYSGRRLRWTSGNTRIEVPNDPAKPPRTLVLELWDVMPDPNASLLVKADGRVLSEGPPRAGPIELPLDGLAAGDRLAIELQAPARRRPGDPRELGVALKQLRLRR